MTNEQRQVIIAALAPYGADLTDDNHIRKGEKATSVRVVVKGRRLRCEGAGGQLIFSGPIDRTAISTFVEKYWFWRVPKNIVKTAPSKEIG